MNPDLQKQILIEQRITNEGKSLVAAYILWAFLGTLGAHRFYLNRIGSAITMLALSVIGWLGSLLVIGFIPLLAVWIWTIIDAFMIPGIVQSSKEKLRQRLNAEMAFFSSSSVPATGV